MVSEKDEGDKVDKFAVLVTSLKVSLTAINTVASNLNLPFVSVIPGVLDQLLSVVELAQSNKEGCLDLVTHCFEIFNAIVDALNGRPAESIDESLKSSIVKLKSTLDLVVRKAKKISQRRCLMKLLLSSSDAGTIEALKVQVTNALTYFNIRGQVGAALTINTIDQRINVFLMSKSVSSVPTHEISLPQHSSDPPPYPAVFFGRDEFVAEAVKQVLHSVPARLAVLGPGGIGKTTVVAAILNDKMVLQRYPHSRLFVHCDALTSFEMLVHALFVTLHVPESKVKTDGRPPSLVDQLISFLMRPSTKSENSWSGIIVLDNLDTTFESTGSKEQTLDLLARMTTISSLTLLITMRGKVRPLRVPWTQPHLEPLDVLSIEGARSTYLAISSASGIGADLKGLDDLLRAVDCLPLAVVLLAQVAQTNSYSPVELLKLWKDERTKLLTLNETDNLDVSISLSINSGSVSRNPSALKVLSLISFFPQGVHPDVLKYLAKDLPFGLISAVNALSGAGLAFQNKSSDKFWKVLSPIRFYVLENHPVDNTQFERIKEFYLPLAQEAADVDFANGGLVTMTKLEGERENIEEVLMECLKRKPGDRAIVEAVLHFSKFLLWSSSPSCELLEKATSQIQTTDVLRAKCLQCLGMLKKEIHDYTGAKENMSEAIQIFGKKNETKLQALSNQILGDIEFFKGHLDDSQKYLSEALKVFIQDGHKLGEANCLQSSGDIAMSKAEYEKASKFFNSAIQTFHGINELYGEGYCLSRLAHVELLWGHLDEAKEHLNKSKDIFKTKIKPPHTAGEAKCVKLLGDVAAAESDFQQAEELYENAIILSKMVNDLLGEAQSNKSLADVAMILDKYQRASELLSVAKEQFVMVNDPWGIAQCLKSSGNCYHVMNKNREAKACYNEAKDQFSRLQDRLSVAQCDESLANIFKFGYDYDTATKMFEKSKQEYESIGYSTGVLHCQKSIGEIHNLLGEFEKSHTELEAARMGSIKAKDLLSAAQCLNSIGDNLIAWGKPDEAEREHIKAIDEYNKIGDKAGAAESTRSLGLILGNKEDYKKAETILLNAKSQFETIEHSSGVAICQHFLGNVYRLMGDKGRSDEELKNAADVFQELEIVGIAQDYLKYLGKVGDPSNLKELIP